MKLKKSSPCTKSFPFPQTSHRKTNRFAEQGSAKDCQNWNIPTLVGAHQRFAHQRFADTRGSIRVNQFAEKKKKKNYF